MEITKNSRLLFTILLALFIQLCAPFGFASAETQYVTDMLILNLRDNPSKEYKVITGLKTNTPVEVLEERGRYLRVQTKDGEEGWVPKQYITAKTPKPLIIEQLKKQIDRLKEKIGRLEESRASLRNDLDIAGLKRKELEKKANTYRQEASLTSLELNQVTKQHNTLRDQSGNVVKLMAECDRLRAENGHLNAEVVYLRQEIARPKPTAKHWWILGGWKIMVSGLDM